MSRGCRLDPSEGQVLPRAPISLCLACAAAVCAQQLVLLTAPCTATKVLPRGCLMAAGQHRSKAVHPALLHRTCSRAALKVRTVAPIL